MSGHRAVVFFRHVNKQSGNKNWVDTSVFREEAWRAKVALRFNDFLKEDPGCSDPLRKLFLVKKAMQEVTSSMSQEKKKSSQEVQSQLIDDKIGWSMKAVHAIERRYNSTLRRCIRAYPFLGSIINPYSPNLGSRSGVRKLRDHAVKLHKEKLLEELQEVQREAGSTEEGQLLTRRSKLQFKLSRLKPGSCSMVGAILGRGGVVVSDPAQILAELRYYWHQVFSGGSCDDALLSAWARDELKFPDWSRFSGDWSPTVQDMAKMVKAAGNAAPGPDGIPFEAWKALGPWGVELLYEAAMELTRGDMDSRLSQADIFTEGDKHAFNVGNMVFLPKKASGVHPLFGEYFAPGDVRPLVIVNADNRMIANLFRRRWEPILDTWISDMQQGFLPGRSMAANIVGVDYEAKRVSLSCPKGAVLLLDFRAAFPSVSQQFLHGALENLGLPEEVRWLVKNLYCSHRCELSCRELSTEGFDIRTGIRQGCPLSQSIGVRHGGGPGTS